jgi:hypothetical protein
MKHFDKIEMIKAATKVLKALPDGSRGPEDMFIAGASHMHKIMLDEAGDLRAEIGRLNSLNVQLAAVARQAALEVLK